MKKIVLIFLSLTMFTMASTSREEVLDNMDYFQSRISESMDTMSTSEATNDYYEYLNKDINDTYKYLLSKLKKNIPLKNAFIESQSQWLKQRDKEFAFIDLAFEVKDGEWGGSWRGISIISHKINVLEIRLNYLVNLIPVEGDISGISKFY